MCWYVVVIALQNGYICGYLLKRGVEPMLYRTQGVRGSIPLSSQN